MIEVQTWDLWKNNTMWQQSWPPLVCCPPCMVFTTDRTSLYKYGDMWFLKKEYGDFCKFFQIKPFHNSH